MNSTRGRFTCALLAVIGMTIGAARAWAQASPSPVMPPATTPPPADAGSGTAIAAVVVVVGLLVIIGVAVKLFDLRRKRESEAVQLQAQVSDALLRDPSLAGLPLTPTARVPIWTGSPATIDITGQVPNDLVKEVALRLVRDEAFRIRPDVQIEDRLSVVPTMARAA